MGDEESDALGRARDGWGERAGIGGDDRSCGDRLAHMPGVDAQTQRRDQQHRHCDDEVAGIMGDCLRVGKVPTSRARGMAPGFGYASRQIALDWADEASAPTCSSCAHCAAPSWSRAVAMAVATALVTSC